MTESKRRAAKNPGVWMTVGILSAISLLLAGWGGAQYRSASVRGPLLVSPTSVAVDSKGNVYCADAQGLVHKYAADGEARGAWSVDPQGGILRLGMINGEHIEVTIEATSERQVFSEGGKLLETFAGQAGQKGQVPLAGAWVDGPDGVSYAIENGALLRRGGVGDGVVVPAIPFPLTPYAWAPWTLVLGLALSPLCLIAAAVMPWRVIDDV